ncbi:MAG TPA: CHAD domain-containing protein [Candidatus Binatia bacterium]|nr:CHAD domain-containing protein [Candidatus Binatia bacterium]
MTAAALAPVPARPRLVLSPDDDAILAARATVRFHLRAFAAVEEDARAGEVEAVHQLRVATRRLRAALRLFEPVLPARFVRSAEEDLGWLADAIGAVRDRDVLYVALKTLATRLEPELRKAFGPVGAALHDERTAALETLETALDSDKCRRLLARLGAFVEGQTGSAAPRRLGDAAPALVTPLVRAVRRAGRRLEAGSLPADFHRLRVRVKRLRYALETLCGVGGKPVRRLLRELEAVQDVLGEGQDAVTQTAWLRRYADGERVRPATLLPVGAAMQALARRGGKRRRKGFKAWRRLDDAGLFDRALDALGAPARVATRPREAKAKTA